MSQPLLFAIGDGEHSAVTDGASPEVVLNNTEKGDISELVFELEAQRRGWIVASCRGKSRDIDLIVKRPHLVRPVSVQVKLAKWKMVASGTWQYEMHCSKPAKRNGGSTCYSPTAFDIFAAHLADIGKWVFYTRHELGNRLGTSYLPPEARKRNVRAGALSARDPDNWGLLDEVAQSFT
jgi:hypothetical protein